uniref:DUF4604 domain-containing protein n=1 Tax=Caenorhabditis tropicalis TaxID=1561998 RepID=A0A1I7TH19_9PELO
MASSSGGGKRGPPFGSLKKSQEKRQKKGEESEDDDETWITSEKFEAKEDKEMEKVRLFVEISEIQKNRIPNSIFQNPSMQKSNYLEKAEAPVEEPKVEEPKAESPELMYVEGEGLTEEEIEKRWAHEPHKVSRFKYVNPPNVPILIEDMDGRLYDPNVVAPEAEASSSEASAVEAPGTEASSAEASVAEAPAAEAPAARIPQHVNLEETEFRPASGTPPIVNQPQPLPVGQPAVVPPPQQQKSFWSSSCNPCKK